MSNDVYDRDDAVGFDVVEEKVAETEFFLRKMAESNTDWFEFRCYHSAFLSAARTVTLALQRFKDLPGFDTWYGPHRQRLKGEPVAKLLLEARNSHVHGGPHPVRGSRIEAGRATYRFDRNIVPDSAAHARDVLSACFEHFALLLEVVHDFYLSPLGPEVDAQQYYTREHFEKLGKGIDDAEIEVWGWVMESYIEEGLDEDDRWHELRGQVGECSINHLFYSYLGRPTPQPFLPDHLQDFEYGPEDRGWVHVPAGYQSLADYDASSPRWLRLPRLGDE